MECVTTTSYSISLNGSLHGHFKGMRGLRQGDPLSPYLFVICIEYLSRDLKRLECNEDFNFHPLCSGVSLTHLAFADDLMMFSRGDSGSVKLLMGKLQDFAEVSGLNFNSDKSAIYAAGLKDVEMEELMNITGFKQGDFPFKYLGVPLLSSKLYIRHYAPLLNQLENLVQGWCCKSLTYAGRLELLRAVLQGVANFWAGIFPLPAFVLDRIAAIARSFLWGKASSGHKKPLVAWPTVCSPKEEGGLGLFNLRIWNIALLTRVLWNLHAKKDSLWVKWVHLNYLKGRDIWGYCSKNSDSNLIKKIFCIRDQLISKEGSALECNVKLTSWTVDGALKAKNAYDYFRSPSPRVPWCSVVWGNFMPQKFCFISWLANSNKLLTLDRASFMNRGSLCPFCRLENESHDHLFFKCCITGHIWRTVRDGYSFRKRTISLSSTMKTLIADHVKPSNRSRICCLALAVSVYTIWEYRNRILFDGFTCNKADIIGRIQFIILRQTHLAKMY